MEPSVKKKRLNEISASTTEKGTEPEVVAAAAVSPVSDETDTTVRKRADFLSWDDYFMSVAFLSAMRSKDPSTQVGAAIVNEENRIVGIGYNGFPTGCSDDKLPWSRKAADELDTKYMYVVHAEMNAILNKNAASIKGSRIYVALFPCNECAKLIIQSGIKEVIFLSDKYHDNPKFIASRRMFELAGIKCRQHKPKKSTVMIDFSSCEATPVVEVVSSGSEAAISSFGLEASGTPNNSTKGEVSPDGEVKNQALAKDAIRTPGAGWAHSLGGSKRSASASNELCC